MTTGTRILVIDSDTVAAGALAQTLAGRGYRCETAADPDQAIRALDRADADTNASIGVVVIDQDCGGQGAGIELIRGLHEDRPDLVPVVIGGFGRVESAVRAMRCGAADYLIKPVIQSELLDAVDRAIQRHLLVDRRETAEAVAEEPTDTGTGPPEDQMTSAGAESTGAWQPMPLAEAMKGPERRILLAALEANGWNRGQTARQLDINRTTLYKKIRQYRLDEPA